MGEVKVKVPTEHLELFRLAALVEIGSVSKWIAQSAEEAVSRCARLEEVRGRGVARGVDRERTSDQPHHESAADVFGSADYLATDVEILRELTGVAAEDVVGPALHVLADANALAHVLQTMAERVITPRIADETNTTPYDGMVTAKLADLTDALTWAAGEAARLQAITAAEISARREDVVPA